MLKEESGADSYRLAAVDLQLRIWNDALSLPSPAGNRAGTQLCRRRESDGGTNNSYVARGKRRI